LREDFDIDHQLIDEMFFNGPNRVLEYIAGGYAQPDFNLVQPGRVGWCKVQVNFSLLVDPLKHFLVFVHGEIICHNVQLNRSVFSV